MRVLRNENQDARIFGIICCPNSCVAHTYLQDLVLGKTLNPFRWIPWYEKACSPLHTTACPSVVPAVAIHPARPRSDGTTDSLARPPRQADVAKSPVDLNTDEIELLFVQKERAKAKKSVSAVVAPTRSPGSRPRPPPLHITHITHPPTQCHTHTHTHARARTRAGFQLKITAPVRTSHLQA